MRAGNAESHERERQVSVDHVGDKPGRAGVLLAILAVVLAGLVYVNALHNPFVYDDHRTIVANTAIRPPLDLRTLLGRDVTRPMVNISYAIDYRLGAGEPFGFHLTSVLLHMINVWLVFWMAWRVGGDLSPGSEDPGVRRVTGAHRVTGVQGATGRAFVPAALFAVHPLMTQGVGYVSGRSEVLAATFCLAAFLAARRWLAQGGWRWWLAATGAWLLALLTRETAVMLPLALIVFVLLAPRANAPPGRPRPVGLLGPWLALFAIGALVRLAVFSFEHRGDLAVQWLSILDQAPIVWRYVGLLILPADQTIAHVVQPVASAFDLTAIASLIALGIVVAIAWRLRRKDATIAFGATWFLLMLAPSALLVVLGHGEGMAEHRVYFASVGLFLAAGSAAGALARRLGSASAALRWLAVAALAMLLLVLSGRTLLRNAIWSSPVLLWREAVVISPDGWLPHTGLGESLHDDGRHEQAAASFRSAIRLKPAEPLGYFKLALCLAEIGRFDNATAAIDALRARDPRSSMVPTGLGVVSIIAGRREDARTYLESAVAADPDNTIAREWLAALNAR
jgi:hypothetical protein